MGRTTRKRVKSRVKAGSNGVEGLLRRSKTLSSNETAAKLSWTTLEDEVGACCGSPTETDSVDCPCTWEMEVVVIVQNMVNAARTACGRNMIDRARTIKGEREEKGRRGWG